MSCVLCWVCVGELLTSKVVPQGSVKRVMEFNLTELGVSGVGEGVDVEEGLHSLV